MQLARHRPSPSLLLHRTIPLIARYLLLSPLGSEWIVDLGFTVLCYDMFGHGCSDVITTHEYTAHMLSQQLSHLLMALDIYEPLHVVGFSLGCLIASHYAHEHPSSVRSLTLIAPAAGFNSPTDFSPSNMALNLLAKGLWAFRSIPLTKEVATFLGGGILALLSKHCCPSPSHLQALKDAEFAVSEYSLPFQVSLPRSHSLPLPCASSHAFGI